MNKDFFTLDILSRFSLVLIVNTLDNLGLDFEKVVKIENCNCYDGCYCMIYKYPAYVKTIVTERTFTLLLDKQEPSENMSIENIFEPYVEKIKIFSKDIFEEMKSHKEKSVFKFFKPKISALPSQYIVTDPELDISLKFSEKILEKTYEITVKYGVYEDE